MIRLSAATFVLLVWATPASAAETTPAPKASKEIVEKGRAVYATACAPCHGVSGVGDGPAAAALTPRPRDLTKDPFKQGSRLEDIFKTITLGVKDTPMIAWGHLPEEDRWALAHFVRELIPKGPRKKPALGK